MEAVVKPLGQVVNPYASFPAFDRTKLEIIDDYISALDAWKVAAKDQHNPNKLMDAVLALLQWYVWVHGFTVVKAKVELKELKNKFAKLKQVQEGKAVSEIIDFNELSGFILVASEYMYELKITNILVHQRPDKLYLAQGTAER